ncbi:dsDNA nuclease domain-containing protein [Herbaspirillum huttiense]|uniref:dsDNA nuclease domain-containing protein n=1 Tax=Herbaspirillum huttiense TaxID=863372 RepID=UPI0031DCDA8F
MSGTASPEHVLAQNDPGDESVRRFRFQWTWAAIACCALLDKTQKITEIFCEHHEDILVKHDDGKFAGLQVKTREAGQQAWLTTDEAVRTSCARFCKLEEDYPGYFVAFRFLTNHPIRAGKTGKDIKHVLSEIAKTKDTGDALPKVAQAFVKTIARIAKCDEQLARRALQKATADDSLPKIADVEMRLISTLVGDGLWTRAAELAHATVARAARHLAEACGRASSLAHKDVLPGYLPITPAPIEAEMLARIEGKRIDTIKLLSVLEEGISSTLPLDGHPEQLPELGKGSPELLRAKLDAGGFSAISLNSAADLRDKADYLGLTWTKKFGKELGLQRYSHIRSVVLADAASAFEATKLPGKPMGISMLDQLRVRFHKRRRDNVQLYECSDEHLEGVAYSLTAECKVQWSVETPWERKK